MIDITVGEVFKRAEIGLVKKFEFIGNRNNSDLYWFRECTKYARIDDTPIRGFALTSKALTEQIINGKLKRGS